MKYIKVNKSTKNKSKSKSKKIKTKGGNKIDDKIDNTSDINNFIINFYNKIVPTNISDNIDKIINTPEGKLIQNIANFISEKIKTKCYETINNDGIQMCANIFDLLVDKKNLTEIIESYNGSDSGQILQLLNDYYNLPDTTPTPIPNNTKELSKEDKIFEVIKSITKNINDIITYIHQQRSTHQFDFNPLLKDTKCSDKLKIENPIDFINGLEFILKDLEKKSVGTTYHNKKKQHDKQPETQPETTINDDDDAKKYEGVLYTPSFEY